MSPQNTHQASLLERIGNALVYVLAFPFIAMFIAMKRIFTERHEPARSYRANLPPQKSI
ncbi:hypothetical protein AAFC00_002706 [Neodothiora populina]|uniref:Uncharacterized protein n=1 Tax=Neodothiora populina TaxID=2781224 RepID=A0ABR3P8N4_9PEZI